MELRKIADGIDTQALARASEMDASPVHCPIDSDTTRNDS